MNLGIVRRQNVNLVALGSGLSMGFLESHFGLRI